MNPDEPISWTRSLDAETMELPLQGRRSETPRAAVLTVLCHPKASRVGEVAILTTLVVGEPVAVSRLEPIFRPPTGDSLDGKGGPLADPYLSRSPFFLEAHDAQIRISNGASGTPIQVQGEPLEGTRDFSPEAIQWGVVLELANRVVLLLHFDHGGPRRNPNYGLVGESDAVRWLREEIRRVAELDVAVLIRGETGTGKELVAQAIHRSSGRRGRTFLSVNMAAVPASVAAAELFGAAKGAFTGADADRPGYFGRAQGGTLFMDEVGETPLEVQVTLLRALETGEVQAVGAAAPRRVDVRLVAATDRNLEEAVAAGQFRAPLLHRLGGYEIVAPPLRDRREDFGRLLFHFLHQELAEFGLEKRLEARSASTRPWISASLVARLALMPWPGNIRQLRNVARQLVIASRGHATVHMTPGVERLLAEAADPRSQGPSASAPASVSSVPEVVPTAAPDPGTKRRYRRPSEVDEAELLAALEENRWRLKPTAEALGVSRTSLYTLVDQCPAVRTAAQLSEEEIREAAARHGGDARTMAEELRVSRRGLRQRMRALDLLALLS
jgi:two-component system, NtrC family, nitrogen regulation response regulator GlnG